MTAVQSNIKVLANSSSNIISYFLAGTGITFTNSKTHRIMRETQIKIKELKLL
uniref:Uncharacterized protein n=1 Tax=Arundo donax TaxID=35708 RepID=A0A0A9CSD0_ARUDO